MSNFDVFEDDPFEQRMKSTIAEWFRDDQARKLEQARSLAVKLEGEVAELEHKNSSLERALFEAEREVERLNIALENTCKAYAETLLELQEKDDE
jgi:predicted RNase H-like nuclease (RuvC/YqgF family)